MNKTKDTVKLQRRRLVNTTAAKLRSSILAREPGAYIGSLTEVAELLGVGIVTVQQTARILEHEGFLVVRRGPGGGYYGTRPDEAALERSVATYMQVHGSGHSEAVEVVTLLNCEIIAAAARCTDVSLREALTALNARIDVCDTMEERIAFEEHMYHLMFRTVSRPLIELLTRVGRRLYEATSIPALYPGDEGVATWKASKRRLLRAILEQDEELARFEAMRDRRERLSRMRQSDSSK